MDRESSSINGFFESENSLYQAPAPCCAFTRDQKIFPLSHDFGFIGMLLANWPAACPEVLVFKDGHGIFELRFKSSDDILCLPLSGEPTAVKESRQLICRIPKFEAEHCFYTRFFQLRLFEERQQYADSQAREKELLVVTENSLNQDALSGYNSKLFSQLQKIIESASQIIDSSNRLTADGTRLVFCPLDGWIEPLYKEVDFTSVQSGKTKQDTLAYLLCPHCYGNIDYRQKLAA